MDQGQGRLTGRTALITGASRNIGRAIALAFAAEGADLVLNTRANRGELDAVAEECRKAGVRAVPLLADIADADAVEAMVGQARAELGAIDVLVCNAAIRPHKAVDETSLEDWRRVIGVNLDSAFYLARAVVPGMKERRRGSIIALGGQSSLTGGPIPPPSPRPRPVSWASCARSPPSSAPSASAPTWWCPASSTPSGATPSGTRSFARIPRARRSNSSRFRSAGSAARGYRRRLRLPRLRRLVLCHRRQHPCHGRPRHRLERR
jgi:NAD(P)-dependent dehydrogenase (short-subunit alcohol dehydrogenase family)